MNQDGESERERRNNLQTLRVLSRARNYVRLAITMIIDHIDELDENERLVTVVDRMDAAFLSIEDERRTLLDNPRTNIFDEGFVPDI